MVEEIEEVTGDIIIKTVLDLAPEETPEQGEERLKREDYARRNAQAVKERQEILRRNGVIGPDETLDMDTEAAIRQRCCN